MAIIDRQHQTHAIKASLASLQEAVRGADSHGVIELKIDGESETRKAILKSISGDPLAHSVFTATFQEVAESDTIKTDIHVVAVGHSDDTDNDGIVLTAITTEIKVRAQVSKLPDHIEVDVSKLQVGEHINAGDVILPEGVELMSSPDAALFSVSRIAQLVTDTEETEAVAESTEPAEAS